MIDDASGTDGDENGADERNSNDRDDDKLDGDAIFSCIVLFLPVPESTAATLHVDDER